MDTPVDCRSCGRCCFSPAQRFVPVFGRDWTRLGPSAERLAAFYGTLAFMRMRDGHCCALEVRRFPGGGFDYFCTVYERRPQTCRDLDRGSPECEGERMKVSPARDRLSTGQPAL
jgi:hypothetical protein